VSITSDYAVLVVNLDQSPERMERTKAAFFRSPVPLRRIPGVYGGYIPSAACRALTGLRGFKATQGRGTVIASEPPGLSTRTSSAIARS
jgi:hypothetical protein